MKNNKDSAPKTSMTLLRALAARVDDNAMDRFFEIYSNFIFTITKYLCRSERGLDSVFVEWYRKRDPEHQKRENNRKKREKNRKKKLVRTAHAKKKEPEQIYNLSTENKNQLRNIWLKRLADKKDQFQQVICHVYGQMYHELERGKHVGKRNIEAALEKKIQDAKEGKEGTFRKCVFNWVLWGIRDALEEELKLRGNTESIDGVGLDCDNGKSDLKCTLRFEKRISDGAAILRNEQSPYDDKGSAAIIENDHELPMMSCNGKSHMPVSYKEVWCSASSEVKESSLSLANSVIGVLKRYPKFNSICRRYGVDCVRDCLLNKKDGQLVERHHISQQKANFRRHSLWKNIRPFILQAFQENGADLSLVLSDGKDGKEFKYLFYQAVNYLFTKEAEKLKKCKIHSWKSSRER